MTASSSSRRCKLLCPNSLANKLRKLDLACKVARHLSSALLDGTIAELKTLMFPIENDISIKKDTAPDKSSLLDDTQELKDRIANLEEQIQELRAGTHFTVSTAEHPMDEPPGAPTADHCKQLTLAEAFARDAEKRQVRALLAMLSEIAHESQQIRNVINNFPQNLSDFVQATCERALGPDRLHPNVD